MSLQGASSPASASGRAGSRRAPPDPTRRARAARAFARRRRTADRLEVADVAADELDVGVEIVRAVAVLVHLRRQAVERTHAPAAREELVRNMGADEAGTSGDQHGPVQDLHPESSCGWAGQGPGPGVWRIHGCCCETPVEEEASTARFGPAAAGKGREVVPRGGEEVPVVRTADVARSFDKESPVCTYWLARS